MGASFNLLSNVACLLTRQQTGNVEFQRLSGEDCCAVVDDRD